MVFTFTFFANYKSKVNSMKIFSLVISIVIISSIIFFVSNNEATIKNNSENVNYSKNVFNSKYKNY